MALEKYLSEFTFKFESEFDSRDKTVHIRKITEVSMNYVSPDQEEGSLCSVTELLRNHTILPIEEEFEGFKIVRLGKPMKIEFSTEYAQKCIQHKLKKAPILAYWDFHSIVFIISDKSNYNHQIFSEFLSESRKLTHVRHTGILIK